MSNSSARIPGANLDVSEHHVSLDDGAMGGVKDQRELGVPQLGRDLATDAGRVFEDRRDERQDPARHFVVDLRARDP